MLAGRRTGWTIALLIASCLGSARAADAPVAQDVAVETDADTPVAVPLHARASFDALLRKVSGEPARTIQRGFIVPALNGS